MKSPRRRRRLHDKLDVRRGRRRHDFHLKESTPTYGLATTVWGSVIAAEK